MSERDGKAGGVSVEFGMLVTNLEKVWAMSHGNGDWIFLQARCDVKAGLLLFIFPPRVLFGGTDTWWASVA